MAKMGVSDFKAHALQVLDRVAKSRESVVLTKYGKPVAEVIPYRGSAASAQPGRLAGTVTFHGDIVEPLGADDWDVCA